MPVKRLELQFFNEGGTRVTFGLADPKDNLTDGEVKSAMEAMLSQGAFTSANGDLVAIAGARLVSREVSEFAVTE
ncbi:MAG: DUF2922 domain-containing protein [Bacillota bacterium]